MPRTPRLTHPLRDVRKALNLTQKDFAKLVGCSTITIQRVENRRLKMSHKLADKILEATGVNPSELAAGRKAVDVDGNPYTKKSYEEYKRYAQKTRHNIYYYAPHLIRYVKLLLIASQRSGQDKLHSVVAELNAVFGKLATDFDLKKNIIGFLVESGFVRTRIYQVRDLRKFPDYARVIGFKDNKRFKPSKTIQFKIPNGWIPDFDSLHEKPMFPSEIERKFTGKLGLIDLNHPIPDTPDFKDLNEALAKALYWRIIKFTARFTA